MSVAVPFASRLSSPLVAGQIIHIDGAFPDSPTRAEVNFLKGGPDLERGEAALHLAFRFDEKKLVINSYVGGSWGKEERESLPFEAGKPFHLKVRVFDEDFQILANGKEIHRYKHRLPYQEVEYFQVKGDLSLSAFTWGGKFNNVPWESGFSDGHLKAGERLSFYVIPKGDRFNVDLIARNGDILFHYNPRFGEKKVVRNSQKGNTWGAEEREGPFPFEKNIGKTLTIVNEPFSIQILVNDHQEGTFAHRTENPDKDYYGVRIGGDVDLVDITLPHHK